MRNTPSVTARHKKAADEPGKVVRRSREPKSISVVLKQMCISRITADNETNLIFE